MKIITGLFILTALIAISGCSTTSQGVDRDYSFTENPNSGLYSFSTRWNLECEHSAMLPPLAQAHITGVEDNMFLLDNLLISSDFKNPPGYFYIKGGKPGDYNVKWVGLRLDGEDYTLYFEKPLQFKVVKGEVRYLGELTINVSNCGTKMVGDMALPSADMKVTIKDMWPRDSKYLSERLDGADSMTIKKLLFRQ